MLPFPKQCSPAAKLCPAALLLCVTETYLEYMWVGPAETAQLLKVHITPAEDQSLVPSTRTVWFTASCTLT